MANEMTMAEPRSGWRAFRQGDLVKAIAATLAVLAIAAASGFRPLAGNADNDSTLRLVEVRDLIAGQGWFDLHQYRMGLDDGLLMHWSRLVDAPIAAIVLAVRALTGSQAAGETAALIIWPFILFGHRDLPAASHRKAGRWRGSRVPRRSFSARPRCTGSAPSAPDRWTTTTSSSC